MWGFYSFDGETYHLAGHTQGWSDEAPPTVGLCLLDPNSYRRQTRVRRGDATNGETTFDYLRLRRGAMPALLRSAERSRVFVRLGLEDVQPSAGPTRVRVTFHRNTYTHEERFSFNPQGQTAAAPAPPAAPTTDGFMPGDATPWMDWSDQFKTPRRQLTISLSLLQDDLPTTRRDNGNVASYRVKLEFATAPDEDHITHRIVAEAPYHTLSLFLTRLDERLLGDWRIRTLEQYAKDRFDAFTEAGAQPFPAPDHFLLSARGTFEGATIHYHPQLEAAEDRIRALLGLNIPYLHPPINVPEYFNLEKTPEDRRARNSLFLPIWQEATDEQIGAMADELRKMTGRYFYDWGEKLPESGRFIYQIMDEPMLPQVHELANHASGLAQFRAFVRSQVDSPDAVGASSWDTVMPIERKQVTNEAGARCHVLTRRFMQKWNAQAFSTLTRAIDRAFDGRAYTTSCSVGPYTRAMDPYVEARTGAHTMLCNHYNGDLWRASVYGSAGRLARPQRDVTVSALWWPGERADVEGVLGLIEGFEGMYMYCYGPRYIGWSYWVDDDTPEAIERFVKVNRFARMAGRYEDVLRNGVQPPREVAYLLSRSTELWMGAAGGDREYNAAGETALGDRDVQRDAADGQMVEREMVHGALRFDGYPTDVVPEEVVESDGLKDYRVLYVVERNLSAAAQEAVVDWVKAGGTLYLGAQAATHDELNRPHSLLAKLTEVERPAVLVAAEPAGRFYGYGQFGEVWRALDAYLPNNAVDLESLGRVTVVNDAEPGEAALTFEAVGRRERLNLPGARVLARYDDSEAAMVALGVGHGRVIKCGTFLGAALARTAEPAFPRGRSTLARRFSTPLRELLQLPCVVAGLTRPIDCGGREIVAGLFKQANHAGAVVLLANHAPGVLENHPIRVTLDRRYERVRTFSGAPVQVQWQGTVATVVLDLEGTQAIEFLPTEP